MFLVTDTLDERQQKIRSFLQHGEYSIAVLVAAADFEWTLRRTIMVLGHSPTAEYCKKGVIFSSCHGLDRYKEVWKNEVKLKPHVPLPLIIPNWKFFREQAYSLRHKLIHGAQGTTGKKYATIRVETILAASSALAKFSEVNGGSVYQRIKVRRKNKPNKGW